jgi:hypothetical protein
MSFSVRFSLFPAKAATDNEFKGSNKKKKNSCGPLRASKHIWANVFPLAENKLEKLRRHHYVYAALT